jgi:hypothetical protein
VGTAYEVFAAEQPPRACGLISHFSLPATHKGEIAFFGECDREYVPACLTVSMSKSNASATCSTINPKAKNRGVAFNLAL